MNISESPKQKCFFPNIIAPESDRVCTIFETLDKTYLQRCFASQEKCPCPRCSPSCVASLAMARASPYFIAPTVGRQPSDEIEPSIASQPSSCSARNASKRCSKHSSNNRADRKCSYSCASNDRAEDAYDNVAEGVGMGARRRAVALLRPSVAVVAGHHAVQPRLEGPPLPPLHHAIQHAPHLHRLAGPVLAQRELPCSQTLRRVSETFSPNTSEFPPNFLKKKWPFLPRTSARFAAAVSTHSE